MFRCYMTLALSKFPHLNKRSGHSLYSEGSERGWAADQKPVLTLFFRSGSCLDSSRERLVPDQQSWETSMAVQTHKHPHTHKHYNPTIIHTQRGNKCCFSTFQSVCLYHLHTANEPHAHTSVLQTKTDRQTIKQKKKVLLPPPRQMCWDFFSTSVKMHS